MNSIQIQYFEDKNQTHYLRIRSLKKPLARLLPIHLKTDYNVLCSSRLRWSRYLLVVVYVFLRERRMQKEKKENPIIEKTGNVALQVLRCLGIKLGLTRCISFLLFFSFFLWFPAWDCFEEDYWILMKDIQIQRHRFGFFYF